MTARRLFFPLQRPVQSVVAGFTVSTTACACVDPSNQQPTHHTNQLIDASIQTTINHTHRDRLRRDVWWQVVPSPRPPIPSPPRSDQGTRALRHGTVRLCVRC